MNTQVTPSFRPYVAVINGALKTTSLNVAETFGKLHRDILKRHQNLECSPEFNQRNFAQTYYVDAQGRDQPMIEMTRDGFVFLVMGFTGKRAAQWKEAYIVAFNAMEAELQKPAAQTRPPIDLTYQRFLMTVKGETVTYEPVPWNTRGVDIDSAEDVLRLIDLLSNHTALTVYASLQGWAMNLAMKGASANFNKRLGG